MSPPTSKPPRPPQPPQSLTMTLSSLTPTTSIPISLTAILLGIEGPREITIRTTSRKTLVTNLLLCDETHQGRRLTLWGQSALPVTHLRILDIIQITRVISHPSNELRIRHDGRFTRLVPANDTTINTNFQADTRLRELLDFRTIRFPELCAMAERGRLLAREWICDQSYAMQRSHADRGLGTVGVYEFENVRISCVRIRLHRGSGRSNVEAVRALCRRICQRCTKRLPRGEDGNEAHGSAEVRCACGGGTEWGFGWLLLGLREIDVRGMGSRTGSVGDSANAPMFVVVEGEALGRLLFRVDVQRIVEDTAVATWCYSVLETLVKDSGVFRVVLHVGTGTGRPRLVDLQV